MSPNFEFPLIHHISGHVSPKMIWTVWRPNVLQCCHRGDVSKQEKKKKRYFHLPLFLNTPRSFNPHISRIGLSNSHYALPQVISLQEIVGRDIVRLNSTGHWGVDHRLHLHDRDDTQWQTLPLLWQL